MLEIFGSCMCMLMPIQMMKETFQLYWCQEKSIMKFELFKNGNITKQEITCTNYYKLYWIRGQMLLFTGQYIYNLVLADRAA